MNLADTLAIHARGQPDHPAVIDGDRIVSYRDFHRQVVGAAARLQGLGVGSGRLVGLSLRDSVAHLVLFHALARLGALIHPIDRAMTKEDKVHLVRSFGTKLVLIEPDGRSIDGTESCRIDESWCRPATAADDAGEPTGDRDVPLVLAQSSGTTGMPKAAVVTHLQQSHRFMAVAGSVGLSAADRYLSVIEMKHNIGRSMCMGVLHFGGTVIINRETESIARMVGDVAGREITWLYLLPAQLRQLIALGATRVPVFPSLRRLLVSSGTTAAEELRAARRTLTPHVYNVYGVAEAGFLSVAGPDDQESHPDSLGRPVAGIEARVVDDDDRPVASGTIGQIGFRGPALSRDYLFNPEATARGFRDGWFYPGDLAAIDGDGCIALKGRADEVINYYGTKIQPIDIETALLSHGAVVEAAALGIDLPAVQQAPIAFVVVDQDVTEAELMAFCRQRLAPFKLPRRIYKISHMPKNSMGKIVKARLRESMLEAMRRAAAKTAATPD